MYHTGGFIRQLDKGTELGNTGDLALNNASYL
jgi:hypothetical protein